MPGAEGDDMIDQRFDAFGHERLNDVAFDRQTHSRHRRDARRTARYHHGDLACADPATAGLDTGDPAVGDPNAGDLAILNDFDAELVGCTGIAPNHATVTGG